jgi:hypothetical protein
VLSVSSSPIVSTLRAEEEEEEKETDEESGEPRPEASPSPTAERQLEASMMNWLLGPRLSASPRAPQRAQPPTSGTTTSFLDAIIREGGAEVLSGTGEAVVRSFGLTPSTKPGARKFGFYDPDVDLSVRQGTELDGFQSINAARIESPGNAIAALCIYVTGTRSDVVPRVLVHLCSREELKQGARELDAYVATWTERARERLRRLKSLPRPGKWELRPLLLDLRNRQIVYPLKVPHSISIDPMSVPARLRLIVFTDR